MTEIVGWVSSAVLFATIVAQITRQWRSGTSKGVSIRLFIGQASANVGFITYAALLGNKIFVVTNSFMFVAALTGLSIVIYHRHHGR
jgi:uncharacterized protein with PQ loop repeat